MKTYDYNCKYVYDFLDVFGQINDNKNLCYIKNECNRQLDDTISSLIVFADVFENEEFKTLKLNAILNPLYEVNVNFYKYDLSPLFYNKKNEKFICYNLNDKKFYNCKVYQVNEKTYKSFIKKDNILLKDDFYAIEFEEFDMSKLVDFDKLSILEKEYKKYFKLLYEEMCKNKYLNKLLNKKTYFFPIFGMHRRFINITKNICQCLRKILPENYEQSVIEKLLGNCVVVFCLISKIHLNLIPKL